ncbi:MAG: DUF3316 domain-containing protein [Paludibacter sp.]|nr:DUF3316 domain-containing protein [Paludibacter sp.]
MKKLIFAIFVFMPFALFSQKAANYHLTTSDWQIGASQAGIKDPYLSPLRYEGSGIAASWNNKSFFMKSSEKYIETFNISAFYNFLLNPAHTAAIQYAGGNANYGVHYRLNALQNLSFLLGTSADIDLGFRYLARNSNNPFNMDLAANLNFSAAAQLKIPFLRRVFLLDASIRTPLLGAMFVPQQGASYYEMGTFDDGLNNTIHFSHLGNKNGLRTMLGLDIPLRRLTIRISGNAEFLKFKANDAVYSRTISGFGIGFKYSFISFAGRKNIPPENFVNP